MLIFGSDMRPLFVILGVLLRMIAAPADALLVIKKVEVRAFKLCYTSLSCRNPEAPVMLNEYVPQWGLDTLDRYSVGELPTSLRKVRLKCVSDWKPTS